MKSHVLPIIDCACFPLPRSRETWWEYNMGWGMIGSDSGSECNTFKQCNSLKMHLLHQQCSHTKLLTGLFNEDRGTQLRRTSADTYRTWIDVCTEQITFCDCNTELVRYGGIIVHDAWEIKVHNGTEMETVFGCYLKPRNMCYSVSAWIRQSSVHRILLKGSDFIRISFHFGGLPPGIYTFCLV